MKKLNLKYSNRVILGLIANLFIIFISFAQTVPKLKDPSNPLIIEHAFLIDSLGGLIYWNEGALTPGSFFTTHRSNTGLGDLDSMLEVITWKDSLLEDEDSPAPDLYHTLYQQYYNGLKVEGAEYTLHHDGEEIWISSGFIAEGLLLSVTPQISESVALSQAISHLGFETWIWDSIETEYPDGELLIIFVADSNGNESFKLAWKFTIVALSELYNSTIYIDATTGGVCKKLSNIHDDSFNHYYYGNKYDLDTRVHSTWIRTRHYLFANDFTRNIYSTDDLNYHDSYFISDKYWNWEDMPFSNDDIWGNDKWSATAAHYCASKSWDYFKQTPLNRKGMTGWGKHVRIVADYKINGNHYNNASYVTFNNEDYILVGRYTNNNYLGTYDIIGHEFTHGVTNRSRPLPYEKISGALNESFSDIFGYMIERYSFGYHRNWTFGEDANALVRDMKYPNSFSNPSFYMQPQYWVNVIGCTPVAGAPPTGNDFCGVHFNSGVQNKWFQLLTDGGTNNVYGSSRNVAGIGADKAARIAYYTLINYKNYDFQNSNFNTVRANSIASAAILYGMCSNEYNNTCAAWHAVNVGNYNPCALSWRISRFLNNLTGLKNNTKSVFDVTLFPNPTSNSIKLFVEQSALNENTVYKINIFDNQGKLVLSSTTSNINGYEINVQSISEGIYNLIIINSNWTKSIKFVKQ